MRTKLCYFTVIDLTLQGMGQKLTPSPKLLTYEWTKGIMHLTHSSWHIMSNKCIYIPYPSFQQRKRGWCAAIKTNPKGHIETNIPIEEAAY